MEPVSATIPSPSKSGLYSTVLDPDFESLFVSKVQTASAGLLPVDEHNAGQALFAIQKVASKFSELPNWPLHLRSLEGCEELLRRTAELIVLLIEVYESKAFAWFCENVDSILSVDLRADVNLRELMNRVKVK
ncbi:11952_t:CDS:2, partial [Acaulospora colombiana]